MTFEEFLALVRKRIGDYRTDAYWKFTYDNLKEKSFEYIERELPWLTYSAIDSVRVPNNYYEELIDGTKN